MYKENAVPLTCRMIAGSATSCAQPLMSLKTLGSTSSWSRRTHSSRRSGEMNVRSGPRYGKMCISVSLGSMNMDEIVVHHNTVHHSVNEDNLRRTSELSCRPHYGRGVRRRHKREKLRRSSTLKAVSSNDLFGGGLSVSCTFPKIQVLVEQVPARLSTHQILVQLALVTAQPIVIHRRHLLGMHLVGKLLYVLGHS